MSLLETSSTKIPIKLFVVSLCFSYWYLVYCRLIPTTGNTLVTFKYQSLLFQTFSKGCVTLCKMHACSLSPCYEDLFSIHRVAPPRRFTICSSLPRAVSFRETEYDTDDLSKSGLDHAIVSPAEITTNFKQRDTCVSLRRSRSSGAARGSRHF